MKILKLLFVLTVLTTTALQFTVPASASEFGEVIRSRLVLKDKSLSKPEEDDVLWKEYTYDQGRTSTCAAHAVAVALTYSHGLKDIMPNYLYKKAWRIRHNDYETNTSAISYDGSNGGINIAAAMRAAVKFGSYQLPPGKRIIFGGANGDPHGCSFPTDQPRYAFERVVNLMDEGIGSIVDRIKFGLAKYERPVVVASRSYIVVDGETVMRIKSNWRAVPLDEIEDPEERARSVTKRHAYVVFGYDDERGEIYTKNSWGDGRWAERPDSEGVVGSVVGGNAALEYSFVEEYIDRAWVGMGEKTLSPQDEPNRIRLHRARVGAPEQSNCTLL